MGGRYRLRMRAGHEVSVTRSLTPRNGHLEMGHLDPGNEVSGTWIRTSILHLEPGGSTFPPSTTSCSRWRRAFSQCFGSGWSSGSAMPHDPWTEWLARLVGRRVNSWAALRVDR